MQTELSTEIEIEFAGTNLLLCGDGCVFLKESSTLLVADLHLGKDASFRASGIPVPDGINKGTLDQLSRAMERHQPRQLTLLGDLIHDGHSMTAGLVAEFAKWRKQHSAIAGNLIRGNHDRHVVRFPDEWKLNEHDRLSIDGIDLIHVVGESLQSGEIAFEIGGHWHPVVFVGRGADRSRFPCFVVTEHSITLPAFGKFKGGLVQKRTSKGVRHYPICEGKIWLNP